MSAHRGVTLALTRAVADTLSDVDADAQICACGDIE
jgi:hypothetical protein